MTTGLAAAALAAALAVPAQAHGEGRPPHWELKETGTDVRFRGLAAVSRNSAWLAGSAGTVLRTGDGGRTWRNVSPPGAQDLQFRDIEAFDARRAVVLAIGEGEASRVYRTGDGGATWTESFRNTDPRAFYDCLTFFDPRHGLAMSDPVDGKFRILSTKDGGRSWKVLPNEGMPMRPWRARRASRRAGSAWSTPAPVTCGWRPEAPPARGCSTPPTEG